jgi:hypothetical protein
MLAYDTTTLVAVLSVFFAVAAIGAALALATIGRFVAVNRRARLARAESVRTYYSGFALTH